MTSRPRLWVARVLALVAIAVPAVLVPAQLAQAEQACEREKTAECPVTGTTNQEGFELGGKEARDQEDATVNNRPRSAKVPQSPTYVDRNFVPACTGNSAFDGGTLCNAAVEACPVEGEVRFWVFETTIDRASNKPVAGTGPKLVNTVCLGPDEPMLDPAVAIPALVQSEFKSVVVLSGAAQVSPKPETLVNIPTRFETDAPASYQIPLTLLNRSVVITATAQRYIWEVGEGRARVSTRPRGYLEYAYKRSGERQVYVDIEWSGTFSVDGGPQQPISGTVTTDGEPTRVEVKQARSELVRD